MALTVLLYIVLKAENKHRDAMKLEATATGAGLERFDDYAYLETTGDQW